MDRDRTCKQNNEFFPHGIPQLYFAGIITGFKTGIPEIKCLITHATTIAHVVLRADIGNRHQERIAFVFRLSFKGGATNIVDAHMYVQRIVRNRYYDSVVFAVKGRSFFKSIVASSVKGFGMIQSGDLFLILFTCIQKK